MTLMEFALLAFSSLFVIVDPIAAVPSFIAMTPKDSVASRLRMARLACTVAAGVLVFFALTGQGLFQLLGITLPAFQLAGSILLFRIALDMLYAKRSGTQETEEEVKEGTIQEDIAITPLAVPMLAGPGAISTVLILMSQARSIERKGVLFVCIGAVSFVSYGIFYVAAKSLSRLNPLILKLATRLMGLFLAAISVQFAFNAVDAFIHLNRRV